MIQRKKIPDVVKLLFLITSVFLILSPSCKKISGGYFPVFYNVSNNTNFRIKVIMTGLPLTSHYTPDSDIQDSVFLMDPGETESLFVKVLWGSNSTNYNSGDSLLEMKRLDIYKYDTILSFRNYRLVKFWTYSSEKDLKGEMSLTVNPGDFNR